MNLNVNPKPSTYSHSTWYNRIKALGAVLLILIMGIFVPVTIALVDAAETFVMSMKREYSGLIVKPLKWDVI